MSIENGSTDGADSTFVNTEVSIPRAVRFWLMLLGNVPSTICAFGLIFHIITDRVQRYALQNHTVLLILLFGLPVQLVDINLYLVFFRYGIVLPSTPTACRLWWLADYGFYCGGIMLMAWLAIERHILIFHDRWVSNRRARFLSHYLPLIVLLGYLVIFYTVANFFLPCENIYIYAVPVCGASPCYQSYGVFGLWEFIVNSCTPIFIEGVVSIALLIRVRWQKRRLHRSNRWRKQRRMIIQLILVSGLNVALNTPIFLIPLLRRLGLPPDFGIQPELYFFYFGYFVIFLFPFASLCQFPKMRRRIRQSMLAAYQRLHRPVAVAPAGTTLPMAKHG